MRFIALILFCSCARLPVYHEADKEKCEPLTSRDGALVSWRCDKLTVGK